MKTQQIIRNLTSRVPADDIHYGGPIQTGATVKLCTLIDPTSIFDLWYSILEVIRVSKPCPDIFITNSSPAITDNVIAPALWMIKEYAPGVSIRRFQVEDGIITMISGINDTPFIPQMTDLTRLLNNLDMAAVKHDIINRYPLDSVANDTKLWRTLSTRGVDGPVDIVFTLGDKNQHMDCMDLRIALRSIDKNGYDVGKVWCVTMNPPKWLNNVEIINGADIFGNNKDGNLIHKLLKACDTPDVSNRFIFWSDDQVLNREFPLSKHIPAYNPRGIQHFDPNAGRNKWSFRMWNTLSTVERMGGISVCNWDSHIPQPIDKSLFKSIMSELPYTQQPGLCINTAYFGVKYEYPRIDQRSVKTTYEDSTPVTTLPDTLFIGYNDDGINAGLRPLLLDKFGGISKYEKTP